MSIDAVQLDALYRTAGFIDRSAYGRLWLTGADVLDLLNRLTTNQLETLPAGCAAATVLTNGDARVIDHLRLAALDDGIWCVVSPGRAEAVAEWIDLYTFAEEAIVEDRSGAVAQLTVAGPQAAAVLADAGYAVPDVDRVSLTGATVVIAAPFGEHPAYDLLIPAEEAEHARESLRGGAAEVTSATFEAYRIGQGVPAYGAEFGEFNNPLEARLLGSISEDKGCYTGQEVIARLQTYRKIQRRLMSFSADAVVGAGAALQTDDGSSAGIVTSAYETSDGRAVGLALVASKHAIAGAALGVATAGGAITLAEPAYALATEPTEA